MPYYARKRNYRKKKPAAKKSYARRKVGVKRRNYLIPKNPQYTNGAIMRRTCRANLTYVVGGLQMQSVAGTCDSHIFRLNSIFDPTYATGGHQPMGRDQYATLYGGYKVLGCKITARFHWDHSATVGTAQTVGISFHAAGITSLSADQDLRIERNHGKAFKILKANSRDQQTVVAYWSPRKYFGKELAIDGDSVTPMSTDPVNVALCSVWSASADRSANASESTYCDVTINYLVEFSDPLQLTQS